MTRFALTLAALAGFTAAAPAAAQYGVQYGTRYDTYATAGVDVAGLGTEIDTAVSNGTISSGDASELRSQLRGLINLQRQYAADGLSASERTDLQQRAQGLRNEIAQAGGYASGYGRYDNRSGGQYGTYGRGYDTYGTARTYNEGTYGSTYGSRYGSPGYNAGTYGNGYTNYNSGTYGNGYSSRGYNGGAYGNSYSSPGYNAGTYGNAYGNGYNRNGYGNNGYATNGRYGQYDRDRTYRDDRSYDRDDSYRDDRDDDDADGIVLRVGDRATAGLYGVPDEYRARFRDTPYAYYRYGGGNIYQIDARNGTVTRVIRIER